MKKFLMILSTIGLLANCSISPDRAEKKYNKLDKKFDSLVDNEISEKKRRKLEKDYKKLEERMSKSDESAMSTHLPRVREKIQYLEDLAD